MQLTGLQSGYAFVYFDSSLKGQNACMQSAEALKRNVTIANVTYSGHILYSNDSFTLIKDGNIP